MELVTDLNNAAEKQTLLALIRNLTGVHRVEIVKYRKRRSDAQNRYYWPAIIAPFGDYLRGQGSGITDEGCHEMLKWKFLRQTIVDPGTGEVVGEVTQSTTALSVEEFGDYLEKVSVYLDETFGVRVQCPEVFKAGAA